MGSKQRVEGVVEDLLSEQWWLMDRSLRREDHSHARNIHPILLHADIAEIRRPSLLFYDGSPHIPQMIVDIATEIADPSEVFKRACDDFGRICHAHGFPVIAVAVAVDELAGLNIGVRKLRDGEWQRVHDGSEPIDWIPTPDDVEALLADPEAMEVALTVPDSAILSKKAREVDRLFHRVGVDRALRPIYVTVVMVALAHAPDRIRQDPDHVLRDVNREVQRAFEEVGQGKLASHLALDEGSAGLADAASRVLALLERLNLAAIQRKYCHVRPIHEPLIHYLTRNPTVRMLPFHIARWLVDICELVSRDKALDATRGIENFLFAWLQQPEDIHESTSTTSTGLKDKGFAVFEHNPVAAALYVGHLMLWGGDPTLVRHMYCFTSTDGPSEECRAALLIPPLETHQNARFGPTEFIHRALDSLGRHGKLVAIVPNRLLRGDGDREWRNKLISNHLMRSIIELDEHMFLSYSRFSVSALLIENTPTNSREYVTTLICPEGDGSRTEPSDGARQWENAQTALEDYLDRPGLSTRKDLSRHDNWTPRRHISSPPLGGVELSTRLNGLIERHVDFYQRNAERILYQRKLIERRKIACVPYRDFLSNARRENAASNPKEPGTLSWHFDAYQGDISMTPAKHLRSGPAMVAQPEGLCDSSVGWVDLARVFAPPFIIVCRTGDIGDAFVQMEPCAVGKNCLLLLPKVDREVSLAKQFLAAALIQHESWRYDYGYLPTPPRVLAIAMEPMPDVERWIEDQLERCRAVVMESSEAVAQPA